MTESISSSELGLNNPAQSARDDGLSAWGHPFTIPSPLRALLSCRLVYW